MVINISKGSSSFAKSVFSLSSGILLTQIIGAIASPITSRIFTPEAFGITALFGSFASILSSISCLRYEQAIVLPKEDSDAVNIVGLCLLVMLIILALISLAVTFLGSAIVTVLNAQVLLPYIWLLPLYVLLTSSTMILESWNTRNKQFKRLAAVRVINSISGSTAMIGGGALGFTTGGNLIVLNTFGIIANPAILLWKTIPDELRYILSKCNFATMRLMARRFIKFPLYGSWSKLLNVVSFSLPIMILTVLFDSTVVGLYSKAFALLIMPINLIGNSVSQVFFQRASEKHAAGEDLAPLVEGLYKRLLNFGFMPFAIIVLVGPELYGFVFGKNWTEAGVYSSILAPWLLFVLVVSTSNCLLNVLNKQQYFFYYNLLQIVLGSGALLLGGLYYMSARVIMFLFSGIGFITTSSLFFYLLYVVNISVKKGFYDIIKTFLYATPTLLIIYLLKWRMNLPFLWVFLLGLLVSGNYWYLVLKNDGELRKAIANTLTKIWQNTFRIKHFLP